MVKLLDQHQREIVINALRRGNGREPQPAEIDNVLAWANRAALEYSMLIGVLQGDLYVSSDEDGQLQFHLNEEGRVTCLAGLLVARMRDLQSSREEEHEPHRQDVQEGR